MRIVIETIPHGAQRYPTVGDWQFDRHPLTGEDALYIKVSEFGSANMHMLVAVHELVEALLCKHRDIAEREVDQFDKAFTGPGEPGDDMAAPYWQEHQFASGIERLLAAELGVNWVEYERLVDALP